MRKLYLFEDKLSLCNVIQKSHPVWHQLFLVILRNSDKLTLTRLGFVYSKVPVLVIPTALDKDRDGAGSENLGGQVHTR